MLYINLLYYKDKKGYGNFGDELSKFITYKLLNKKKYKLVCNNLNCKYNLICIGSYIHIAKNNTFIFGSGVRTPNNLENLHNYNNLNVCSIRGPLSRDYLINKKINVPEIYGDPALLLPLFYKPILIDNLKEKIGIIPHKSNYKNYVDKYDDKLFYLINPRDEWTKVINELVSCKYIISSSLHGLICADAYNKPNIWLDEYKLKEGDFKFRDYFLSQHRKYIKIEKIEDFDSNKLYRDGNTIDLNKLIKSFPFS